MGTVIYASKRGTRKISTDSDTYKKLKSKVQSTASNKKSSSSSSSKTAETINLSEPQETVTQTTVPAETKAAVTSQSKDDSKTADSSGVINLSKEKEEVKGRILRKGYAYVTTAVGNAITAGLEKVTGQSYGRTSAAEFSQSTVGKVLSTAASITVTALAFEAIAGAVTAGTTSAAASESLGTITKTASTIAKNPETMTTQWAFKSTVNNPTITKLFNSVGRIAANSKTAGLKVSYLSKLASTAKNPIAVLGLLGTTLYTSLFWAPNEKGDALMTLSIAEKEAAEAGNVELVNEIDALIQETNDIAASIPVVGFIKSELAKFKAAAISSKTYKETAAGIAEEAAAEETEREEEAAYWEDVYAQQDERERASNQADVDLARLWSDYYDAIDADDNEKRDEILKQIEEYYD